MTTNKPQHQLQNIHNVKGATAPDTKTVFKHEADSPQKVLICGLFLDNSVSYDKNSLESTGIKAGHFFLSLLSFSYAVEVITSTGILTKCGNNLPLIN